MGQPSLEDSETAGNSVQFTLLSAIVNSSDDAIVGKTIDGVITSWNPAAERMYGYSPEEIVGQPIATLCPAERVDEIRLILEAIGQGRRVVHLETVRLRKDGTTIPVSLTVSPIFDEGGGLIGASSIARDMTTRHQLRTATDLQRAEARFRALIDAAPDAIVCADGSGQITLANAQTERLFGYRRAELEGQLVEMLVPDAVRAVHPQRRAGYMADPVPRPMGAGMELSGRRRDGSTFPAEISLSAIDTEEGTLVTAAVRDVTDRQRAEARFRALIDAAPDAMVCVDTGARITLANAQTERLFGYRRAELEGQLVDMLVPDPVRAVHPERRARYVADPVPRPMGAGMQLSGRRRDGSTFPAEISLSAIDTEEGTLVTAAVRDVTEQRKHQDDLERANRTLESFAYSVAHDLRTPLRALAGYSAALMEECGDGLGEAGRGYAERIQAASEQMGTLIDDLLHLSRVSRAVINLREVDLGAEAASIAEELQHDCPDRRVRFRIDRPVMAVADRTLVRIVLKSLLGNAWKFTSRRENASIEFGTTPTEEAGICCYVRDNGVGFDPAYVDKLFRPFQRLHTTREFAGTGVGLASVKQIVERHGGRAWAQGTVDAGATFYFTLDTKGVA